MANFVWRGVLVFRALIRKPPLLLLSDHAFWESVTDSSQKATVAKSQQMSTYFAHSYPSDYCTNAAAFSFSPHSVNRSCDPVESGHIRYQWSVPLTHRTQLVLVHFLDPGRTPAAAIRGQ